jgi:PadR family transcriptional regulator PadR
MPQRDLIQGTRHAHSRDAWSRALHGYAIALAIEQRSTDELRVEEGALYSALHRLEVAELLTSQWKLSETNRARFYKLTSACREHLAAETSNWNRLATAVARVMEVA